MQKDDYEIITEENSVTREEYNKLLEKFVTLENRLQRYVTSSTAIVQSQEVVAQAAAKIIGSLCDRVRQLEEAYALVTETMSYHQDLLESDFAEETDKKSKSTSDLLELPDINSGKKLVN
jgi:hypothetical protein